MIISSVAVEVPGEPDISQSACPRHAVSLPLPCRKELEGLNHLVPIKLVGGGKAMQHQEPPGIAVRAVTMPDELINMSLFHAPPVFGLVGHFSLRGAQSVPRTTHSIFPSRVTRSE